MEKPNLYCPKCKKYPKEISEKVVMLVSRVWDGECYETVKQDEDEIIETICGNCSTVLEEK